MGDFTPVRLVHKRLRERTLLPTRFQVLLTSQRFRNFLLIRFLLQRMREQNLGLETYSDYITRIIGLRNVGRVGPLVVVLTILCAPRQKQTLPLT